VPGGRRPRAARTGGPRGARGVPRSPIGGGHCARFQGAAAVWERGQASALTAGTPLGGHALGGDVQPTLDRGRGGQGTGDTLADEAGVREGATPPRCCASRAPAPLPAPVAAHHGAATHP